MKLHFSNSHVNVDIHVSKHFYGNLMPWNMHYVRHLEPFLDNMPPNDYVFADYFKPSQGQNGIEAKELYYIFADLL